MANCLTFKCKLFLKIKFFEFRFQLDLTFISHFIAAFVAKELMFIVIMTHFAAKTQDHQMNQKISHILKKLLCQFLFNVIIFLVLYFKIILVIMNNIFNNIISHVKCSIYCLVKVSWVTETSQVKSIWPFLLIDLLDISKVMEKKLLVKQSTHNKSIKKNTWN